MILLPWNLRRQNARTLCLTLLLFTLSLVKHDHADAAENELRREINFNQEWRFLRTEQSGAEQTAFDDKQWLPVSLPHTPRIEPLVVLDQWQGLCWYRKSFDVPQAMAGKRLLLKFEGAMQVADVWLNGVHLTTHHGGYLPFSVDISKHVKIGEANLVAVRLDNRDNPEVPPGKPLKVLDFCLYGGLYRNVKLIVTDPLHVTDAVHANQEASGGVFVTCTQLTDAQATLQIKTHVLNNRDQQTPYKVENHLIDPEGKTVAGQGPKNFWELASGDEHSSVEMLMVANPQTWHPDHPHLYTVRTTISDADGPVDVVETRVGIRTIAFSAKEGFRINGERMYLRGTNRHQEYPYLGYALSDNAQYRDALKIKQAGFDFIRLSHYPHSTAFMDACDELGLVVMDCIPGWQFWGGEKFRERSLQDCRDMIHRDRNHPCVVLWEVSLNETKQMDDAYIIAAHDLTHREYPGDQCYTCGWVDRYYDVYVQARQHGGCHDYTNAENANKACLVSEYGDWEYYAQNAGLDQPGFKNLKKDDRNSRQLRAAGERRLLQQAMNFQEAHNDNLSTPAVGDGLWVMFDYNRGYFDNIEASGPMDIFRLPKFGYYFFRSQRSGSPVVRIANHWTDQSPTNVRVYSNCDEVELTLNGRSLGRRKPTQDAFSKRLPHPPFHFDVEKFEPGVLQAAGFNNGQEVVRHEVRTPEAASRLMLTVDQSERPLQADGADALFVYASVVDQHGTVVPADTRSITFEVTGPAQLIGKNPLPAEAGIATILLQSKTNPGEITVTATALNLEPATIKTTSAPQ